MPVEQYSALVELMPRIEKALEKKGEKIPRPMYGEDEEDDAAVRPEEQQEEENGEVDEAEKVEVKAKNGKRKKSNIEATSDEDEED